MIILGQTSKGNHIWFKVKTNAKSENSYVFSEFDNPEENYDAFAVLEYLEFRFETKNDVHSYSQMAQNGIKKYRTELSVDENRKIEGDLKVRTSIDRANYARKLLRPEFCD